MSINFVLVILIGFLSVIFLCVFLKKLALRYNIFIVKGIPLIGGMSMGLSFVIACLFASISLKDHFQLSIGIMISSLIMLAFGVIDDWHELGVVAKLFVQILATSILVLFGVRTNIIYINTPLNIVITFIWVLGVTNSFNLLDIMDGLAGGIALIASLSFSAISFLNGDANTMISALILSAVILGMLIYNLPPAKIYMGNAGSHFLGFILSAIAITISYASQETKIALVSPLLILGFPIFDTIFLIFMRISKKKLPFNKSKDHFALRLLTLGYSKKKALLVILAVGLFFSLCGVAISQASCPLDSIIVLFVLLVSLVLSKKMRMVLVYD